MTDLTKLKELAELASKATPGPWWIDSHGHHMVSESQDHRTVFLTNDGMGPATRHPETGNLSHWPNDWDASYIASADPTTILELIAEVERLRGEVEAYEEGMRSLACNLGSGGYNAETLTAAQLVDKVQWGVDNLSETQGRLLNEVRAENTALRKDAERYRELRKITPHRFRKLQEAATTDGGDVFYFHADRFDAALDAALEGGGR